MSLRCAALVLAVGVAQLAAGCLGPDDAAPAGLPPLPTMERTANLTRCTIVQNHLSVPSGWLAPRVPQGFTVRGEPNGVGKVLLQIGTCGKTAFDGRDAGAASWSAVGILVRPPPKENVSGPAHFITELRADAELRPWLQAAHAGTEASTAKAGLDHLPGVYDRVRADVEQEAGGTYGLEGLVARDTRSEVRIQHWFGEGGGTVWRLDLSETAAIRVNMGPSTTTNHADSALRALVRANVAAGLVQYDDASLLRLVDPGPRRV